MLKLKDIVSNVVVIAHNEDTAPLEKALQGFRVPVQVQRRPYSDEELRYPAITRCLLNHQDAWAKASRTSGYTLVCEADFVPVKNIEDFSADWLPADGTSWAHLYTSSPRLLEPFRGFYRAHQATAVCYILNATVAKKLEGFVEDYDRTYGFTSLAPWDAFLQWYAMGQGARMYIPPKSLGEHGGIANKDHAVIGMRHQGVHRADRLAGSLAFTPLYARGRPFGCLRDIMYFRSAGFARVVLNKWIVETAGVTWTRRARFDSSLSGLRRLL